MFRSHFFRRLYLPFVLIIGMIATIIGLLGARHLYQSQIQQARDQLRSTAIVVSDAVGAELGAGNTTELRSHIRRLVDQLRHEHAAYRITVIDASGKVLADNEADPDTMVSHRLRPEVMMALSTGEGWDVRQSETVGDDLLYYAMRIPVDGQTAYIRLAIHLPALRANLRSFYSGLAITTVLCIILAAIAAYYLARRQVVPIVEATAFADDLAGGRLDRRIHRKGSGELGVLANSLNSMADSIKRHVVVTRERQAELQAILQSMTEGVIATDAASHILLANEAAAKLLHFNLATCAGMAAWEVIRHDQVVKAIGDVTQSRQQQHFLTMTDQTRHLEVTVCPFEYQSHETNSTGLVLVIHDVTEAMRYQDLRKEFVANVSHELRTPLAAIKGYVETLRDGAMDDNVKRDEYLAVIERNTNLLANLVSDLLELSKLESQAAPRKAFVEISPLLRQAIELLQPAILAKGHTIDLRGPQPSPVVLGSADYLERAVVNLIDNAVKYTREGGRITVSATADATNVTITVADTGIGIPPQDIDRIFERFYRVDRSRSRDMGGTGLGLAIVKHVVQAHGGTVEVESELNVGTTFRIILPAASKELA